MISSVTDLTAAAVTVFLVFELELTSGSNNLRDVCIMKKIRSLYNRMQACIEMYSRYVVTFYSNNAV